MKGPYYYNELNTVPGIPGIYAWYFDLKLSSRDVCICIETIKQTSRIQDRVRIVEVFLEERVFRFFRETDYSVKIEGKLKPKYEGRVQHYPGLSSSFAHRIAEEPHRLHRLASLLSSASPQFSSPIYIGMAKNLRVRIAQHKKEIEAYQNREESWDDTEEEVGRHSFPYEVVCLRKLRPSNLTVYVMGCEVEPETVNDIENLLNRINYPLCGRN